MVFIGVDPGASGGITFVTNIGVSPTVTPDDENGVWQLFDTLPRPRTCCVAVIERVHSMPRDGVASAFKFGVSYGGLRMALVAAGIPFAAVEPQTWQREFGLLKLEDESDSKHKTRIGEYAKSTLFPGASIPRPCYDSAVIAEYARRHYPRGL